MVPLLRLLESGGFCPGQLHPHDERSLEGDRAARDALEFNLHVYAQDGIPCLGGRFGKFVRIWYRAGIPPSLVSCFLSVFPCAIFFLRM